MRGVALVLVCLPVLAAGCAFEGQITMGLTGNPPVLVKETTKIEPRRGEFRRGLKVRRGKGRYKLNYDLHKVVGFVALPALAIWALTGINFELPKQTEGAYYAVTPARRRRTRSTNSNRSRGAARRDDERGDRRRPRRRPLRLASRPRSPCRKRAKRAPPTKSGSRTASTPMPTVTTRATTASTSTVTAARRTSTSPTRRTTPSPTTSCRTG